MPIQLYTFLLRPNLFKDLLLFPCHQVPVSGKSLFMTSSQPIQEVFFIPDELQKAQFMGICYLSLLKHLKFYFIVAQESKIEPLFFRANECLILDQSNPWDYYIQWDIYCDYISIPCHPIYDFISIEIKSCDPKLLCL